MGGFEGGDEGGYWDADTLTVSNKITKKKKETFIEVKDSIYSIRAHAKVTDKKDAHSPHFMRNDELYDTISFIPCVCSDITIEGCEEISFEENTIFQVYEALNDYIVDTDVLEFFTQHKVVVTKRIPLQEGFGGGASNGAAFLRLVKEVCNLVLSTKELINLGNGIGEDFAFFIHNYASANISDSGEIVECQ